MAQAREGSLRMEGQDGFRLARAFALSLAVHLLVVGGYKVGHKLGIWQAMHLPAWIHPPGMLTELIKKKESPPRPKLEEIPLVFLDVSPAQETPEPPKEAKYYSDKNSLAANPVPKEVQTVPEVDGKQTHVAKTEDTLHPTLPQIQPEPKGEPASEPQPEVKPRASQPVGDLVMAKPDPTPAKGDDDAQKPPPKPPSKPRTIEEALARLGDNRLVGQKMKQEGGVRRTLDISSFDAKATEFGAYDNYLVRVIANRWYGLLDQLSFASDGYGKVVLDFTLHFDGRVTDMNLTDRTVGEALGLVCEKAVMDPAPFKPWSVEMRRMLGESRHIQFTFHYE
jgi:hypothetical protein